MTLYTAFDLTPPADFPLRDLGAEAAAESEAAFDLGALDEPAYRLLVTLFEADGATSDALGARLHTPREAVDGLLRALGRLGYVEREGDMAWLTGEAFGLRQAVRRGDQPVAVPFRNR